MKNTIKLLGAVLAIFFSVTTYAQSQSSKLENSLLWEVSGNGLSKPSYLYGTIHMICSADYFLSEKAKKAFDATNKVVLEINISDPKEMTDLQQMAMGKEPLSKTLSPSDLAKLTGILQNAGGLTVQQVDSFSLFTVMSLITMKTFGCTDLKFYEMGFIEKAKERSLPVAGLETVKEQMGVFAKAYTDTEMIAMLEKSDPAETAKMVALYKEENIEGLYEVTTDVNITSEKTKKAILDDRNLNWIKTMPGIMQNESTFFAVGAAHLGGELGVINLLRKAGYQVKPVTK
ncbi:TraB/GumN family protein [Flavobacterium sp. GA093]|uniref:TraB/GumN family protein n=1 Tax=Flavobacterium hydrocarbonoxydans TaxID=2683249 RepID=A0A6I4NRA6_9FLAO|nr:TraB/GumN family protein [Flavobacterium hydrocarbonoxydans]MWB93627.1 TraB/GumN family protein [Flavobacterium hydrocarbonoxydans]